MRILSWNIRQGGGRRLDAIVAAIAGHEPDVVVVNELRARTTPQLVAAFRANGLAFHQHTSPASAENGTLIAARVPLRRRRAAGPARVFRHGLLEVDVDGWATIGAVYGPLQRATLRTFWDSMVGHATRRANRRYLLIGDFNAGESFVDARAYKFMSSDYLVAIREADSWTCGGRATWRRSTRGSASGEAEWRSTASASTTRWRQRLWLATRRGATTPTSSAKHAFRTTRRCSSSSGSIDARM